jgi:hypothetical protein
MQLEISTICKFFFCINIFFGSAHIAPRVKLKMDQRYPDPTRPVFYTFDPSVFVFSGKKPKMGREQGHKSAGSGCGGRGWGCFWVRF